MSKEYKDEDIVEVILSMKGYRPDTNQEVHRALKITKPFGKMKDASFFLKEIEKGCKLLIDLEKKKLNNS